MSFADSLTDIQSRLDLRKVSNMDEIHDTYLYTTQAALDASAKPKTVAKVENVVNLWCKNIEKVIALSKQIRNETENMGPLAELAYW